MSKAPDERAPIAVLSGATSGIGFEVAKGLAQAGFRLIAMGRDDERIAATGEELSQITDDISWVKADFSSLEETRRAAREIASLTDRIDVLLNNAGIMLDKRYVSAEGYEKMFAVNHLAPFLLTNLLIPQLLKSDAPHVISVSSNGHAMVPDMAWDDIQLTGEYSTITAYNQSKLANALFARELAKRFEKHGLVASAVNPGFVDSRFILNTDAYMHDYIERGIAAGKTLTCEQGADTIIWLATDRDRALPSGGYFEKRERIDPSPAAQNDENAKRLWDLSAELTGISQGVT